MLDSTPSAECVDAARLFYDNDHTTKMMTMTINWFTLTTSRLHHDDDIAWHSGLLSRCVVVVDEA